MAVVGNKFIPMGLGGLKILRGFQVELRKMSWFWWVKRKVAWVNYALLLLYEILCKFINLQALFHWRHKNLYQLHH